MVYETVIGLEIHAELKTKTKIFCSCSTEFGKKPNENTCPICLGIPGTLPVLNEDVIKLAVKAGTALGCKINNYNKMDRKNYFYPDLTKTSKHHNTIYQCVVRDLLNLILKEKKLK